jgi:hypothetical protein
MRDLVNLAADDTGVPGTIFIGSIRYRCEMNAFVDGLAKLP